MYTLRNLIRMQLRINTQILMVANKFTYVHIPFLHFQWIFQTLLKLSQAG